MPTQWGAVEWCKLGGNCGSGKAESREKAGPCTACTVGKAPVGMLVQRDFEEEKCWSWEDSGEVIDMMAGEVHFKSCLISLICAITGILLVLVT